MTGFPLSTRVVSTARVDRLIRDDLEFSLFVGRCLDRYVSGDDGDLDPQDKRTNRRSLKSGQRILASYKTPMPWGDGLGDDKLWIITDGMVDGEWYCTTILWPSDY